MKRLAIIATLMLLATGCSQSDPDDIWERSAVQQPHTVESATEEQLEALYGTVNKPALYERKG